MSTPSFSQPSSSSFRLIRCFSSGSGAKEENKSRHVQKRTRAGTKSKKSAGAPLDMRDCSSSRFHLAVHGGGGAGGCGNCCCTMYKEESRNKTDDDDKAEEKPQSIISNRRLCEFCNSQSFVVPAMTLSPPSSLSSRGGAFFFNDDSASFPSSSATMSSEMILVKDSGRDLDIGLTV